MSWEGMPEEESLEATSVADVTCWGSSNREDLLK